MTVNHSPAFWNRHNCEGLTLVEMLITISILLLITVIVIPLYDTYNSNQQLRSTAEELVDNLKFAQNKALTGEQGSLIAGSHPKAIGYYIYINDTGSGVTLYYLNREKYDDQGTSDPSDDTYSHENAYDKSTSIATNNNNKISSPSVAPGGIIKAVYFSIPFAKISYYESEANIPATTFIPTDGNAVFNIQDSGGTTYYTVTVESTGRIYETKVL